MRRPGWRAMVLILSALLLIVGPPVLAEAEKAFPAGPLITIHAPHPDRFELALDEIELDWSGLKADEARALAASAAEVAGTRLEVRDRHRVVFRVLAAVDAMGLWATARALEVENPGAEANLVLYRPGSPRDARARRLLNRNVGLLLEQSETPDKVLAGLPIRGLRAVPGVPGGYVFTADDPLAALGLADAVRQRRGVRSAYPLLKRFYVPR